MTGKDRKRSLGLAAVLVLGTMAGFLVAAGTGGAEYATVDTIGSDSQAFEMPVEQEEQRVRFTLQADDGTVMEPAASFALYDPADAFFTEFELSGDGDEAEAILGESGPWVLFLTQRTNAQISVQYEGAGDEEAEEIELEEMDVQEERTTIAEQDGGVLDEEVALRIEHRPAVALLEFSGDIQGLDAEIASEQGPVYELTDASANSTQDGTQRDGDATVLSENLVEGTYEVTASADAFDGKLVLVHQTYDREIHTTSHEPQEDIREGIQVADNATLVAEIHEGEAHLVDTAGAQKVAFVLPEHEHAHLKIYNASDRLVEQVELDHDYDRDWDWDDRSESEPSVEVVELPSSGEFAVYASYISDDDVAVQAFVSAEDAPKAEELEVEKQEVQLDGNEASWNTTLPGALLEASAYSRDLASTERNVTMTGELGEVLHYEEEFNTFGAHIASDHEVNPERFTDGALEVTMDGSGMGGTTYVDLVHLAE